MVGIPQSKMKYYAPLTDNIYATATGRSADEWLVELGEAPSNEPNTSFENNFQFVWDSVSLSAFKTCPRYYNWTIREGWRLNPQPSTLAFGIYFHKCMEVWHKLLATGLDKDTALLRCTRLAGLFGELLIPNRPERTKETLIRAVVWYLDQFRDDQAITTCRPDGEPAVEYSFIIPLTKIDETQVYLAGHLDRVVTFMGHTYICDYKTSKLQLTAKFFDGFKPNTQVQGYLAAAHILGGTSTVLPSKPAGLIIDGIQLGVNFARFQRSIIQYTKLEIDSFLIYLEQWLRWAKTLADTESWPANENSCDKYGGCVFRSICSQTPAKHERLLKANFERTVWDPRRSR